MLNDAFLQFSVSQAQYFVNLKRKSARLTSLRRRLHEIEWNTVALARRNYKKFTKPHL